MARTAGQIALITVGTIATGALGYAVYFDYMRRNSPDFRRSLRKQAEKVEAEEKRKLEVAKARQKLQLRAVLREIQAEEAPTSPEAQEAYFQEQVAMGERLATQGPDVYVEAASHFYRALRVYPQPVELLMIYQKVVPAPIFALVIELTQVPGISATAGNPLAALGGLGGAAGGPAAAPPRAAATVSDVDEDVSSAPAGAGDGPGGRVPTDEEIAAIIAAASGRAPGASAQAQPEAEAEAEAEEGEVQEAADELADVMAEVVAEVQKGVDAQAAAEAGEQQDGEAESVKSGASWEKVDQA